MTWFKMSDKLWSSPTWVALPTAGRALYGSAGSWCGDQLTDGFIPEHVLTILGATKTAAMQLATVGGEDSFWITEPGGWRFRDWMVDQPSKEQVLAERDAARDRQRRAREKARLSRESHGVTGDVTPPLVTVPPTRPDPTRPVVPTELRVETVLDEPHLSSDTESERRTKPVRADAARLARVYCDQVKLSNRGHVATTIGIALYAGYQPDQIESALNRLAALGMSVTENTLRIEIDGKSTPTTKPNAATERTNESVAMIRRLEAEETNTHRLAIGSP